jgi:serine protease Do
MNTAVSQSSQGIGFAIAADVLREAIAKILGKPGEYGRPAGMER